MKKRENPTHRKPSPAALQLSEAAILQVAMRHSVSVEEVRRQIQVAMLNGLVNGKMDDIPSTDDIPSPEELIAYGAEEAMKRRDE